MNNEQRQFLNRRLEEVAAKQPRYPLLRERLLQIAGEEIVPRHEPELEALLSDGALMDGPVTFQEMTTSSCHRNVSVLWHEKRRAIIGIGTGYGLSDDGLWRQHSWAIQQHGLLETTTPRERYFGIVLTGKLADAFAAGNAAPRT